MRIGIDGSCLSNRRGFGRFARRLLHALAEQCSAHDFVVFVDQPSAENVLVPLDFLRVIVPVREAPTKAASAQGRRRWRDMFAMGLAVARSRIDLMYFPATYSFFPVWNVPKLVVTMHDTLPFSNPELVFPGGKGRLAWRLKETAAARWADRIVTVSEASKKALQAWSGWPDSRIRVITEGPDPIFCPRPDDPDAGATLGRYGISPDARYLLYVGGLSPHKNLLRLVDAFAQAAEHDTLLVLAGDVNDVFHTHVPQIRAAIAQHGLQDRVILTGFVPDDDLVFLYSRAVALVLPSLMEGFGLPAVEAMACGTPVVSSRAGSLPEVVGDAGVYFEPTDVSSIAAAIESLLNDQGRRESLARRAVQQAAFFTWDASARALLACFDELAPKPNDRSTVARSA
ncbi:MAG TPA: glycosyltransferase family 1 protein [Isosphaeraceae bacterium]|nr:glycosyltransferase family 1 protein [Isosphaeraceae bacterium]